MAFLKEDKMPVFNTTPVQISQLADQYAVRRIILSVFDNRVDEVNTYKRPRWVCLKDPQDPKILCAVYSEKGKKKLQKAIEAKASPKSVRASNSQPKLG